MDTIQKLSPLNQSIIEKRSIQNQNSNTSANLNTQADSVEINGQVKTNKKKKAAIIAGIIALAGAIAGIVYKIKKGKATDAIDDTQKILKRADINFEGGIARLKNGEKFSGVIKDSVEKGKNKAFKPFEYTLEYKDGVLIKSTKTQGSEIIEKTYETLEDRTRKITSTINGSDKTEKLINVSELKSKIDKSKNDYRDLLLKKDDLSAEDFKKKAEEIEYLTKTQHEEITKIKNSKIQTEQLKAEQEAKKAQEETKKAKEAEKRAQEAAEKEAKQKAAKEAEAKVLKKAEEEIEAFKNSLNNKSYDELKKIKEDIYKEEREFINEMKRKYDSFDEKRFTFEEKNKFDTIIKKQHELNKAAHDKRTSEIVFDTDKILKPSNQNLTQKDLSDIAYYQDGSIGSNCNPEDSCFLDEIFKKIKPTDEDCILYRGVKKHRGWKQEIAFEDADFEPGKIINNLGITSTSYNPRSQAFNEYVIGDCYGDNANHYVLRIHCKKGTKAIVGGLGEAILPPNNKMKVLSFNPITKVADVEYIPPENL